jgi:hypothetical protein
VTWGWRKRLAAASGALVLAASFLPWWVLRIAYGGSAGSGYHVYEGNAWRMSTLWSAAVVLAVAAAALALLRRRAVPLALTVLAIGLTVAQVWLVDRLPHPDTTIAASISGDLVPVNESPDAPFLAAWMQRDHLRSFHDPGLYADASWGLWVGLAAMVLVGVTIMLAGRRSVPDHDIPHD